MQMQDMLSTYGLYSVVRVCHHNTHTLRMWTHEHTCVAIQTEEAKRLNEQEAESSRLKTLFVEVQLDKTMLK